MRNILFLIAVIVPLVLGCGLVDKARKTATEGNSNLAANVNANKTLTDKAVDAAVGGEKIGIVECDEVLDILGSQVENPDDNFVTKAVKKTALTTFRDRLKKKLEENKTDKKEVAKFCKDFRDNLQDSAKDGNSNTTH